MSTSSIPAYIDALLAALRARPALQAEDVLVSDSFPMGDLSEVRLLTVGGQDDPTATGEQASASLGRQRREEDYVLNLYGSALTGDGDQKAVRDQAFGLMAEVEDLLRDDPTLGNTVRESYVEGGITLSQQKPEHGGRWAEVAFTIHVKNRI